MMVALVLERDLDVFPAHVKDGDQFPVFAVNGDLGLRLRIAGFDEQQP